MCDFSHENTKFHELHFIFLYHPDSQQKLLADPRHRPNSTLLIGITGLVFSMYHYIVIIAQVENGKNNYLFSKFVVNPCFRSFSDDLLICTY